jgi:hypothetical protein
VPSPPHWPIANNPFKSAVKTAFLEVSKLKALLRAAATRTTPDLWDAIRDHECRNYFAAAGYDAF